LVKPQKEWWIGSKKERGRRGAFISHPHLVLSSHVQNVMLFSEFSALSTAHSMACTTTHFRTAQHLSLRWITNVYCEEKVEVERSQHTQSSNSDFAILGKRGRRARTNIPMVNVFFW